jgi:predicted CoA-binding protein
LSFELSDSSLLRILHQCRRIAVVGLSANPARPSHQVARYLLAHGYEVVPVNPACTAVLGRTCYPDLRAAREAAGPIDMVDCFRRSEEIGALADEAIAIGARCLWMQQGVVNEAAAAHAQAAGLDVVMDRCVKIDHARLIPA